MTPPKVIRDWFTERDGQSWCLVRASAMPVLGVMVYKFALSMPADYATFAGGCAAIFASIAFKNRSEEDRK